MNCARCGAGMLKTELYLSQTLEKITSVSAWRCDQCGRIEYYGSPSSGESRCHQH
jgi:DNA-directed RNA polymerase subunit RPC12/RpoP